MRVFNWIYDRIDVVRSEIQPCEPAPPRTQTQALAGLCCAVWWGVGGYTAEELISSPAWLLPLRRDLASAGREQSLIRGVTNPHFWGSYCNSQAPPAAARRGGPTSREGFETTSLLPAHCATVKVVRPHCLSELRSDLGSIKEKFSSNEVRHESWLNAATCWKGPFDLAGHNGQNLKRAKCALSSHALH